METIKTRASAGRRLAGAGLWVLQVMAAGTFLMAAMGKFTGAEPSASTFAAIGLGDWFRYLVAVLEVAGAVALLVPPLSGAAGLALAVMMVGAVATEAFVSGGPIAFPLVLLVMCAVIAWGRGDRTMRLWERVTGR
jgi:putative oxidoreductase